MVVAFGIGSVTSSAISYAVLQKFEPAWYTVQTNANPKFLELLPEGHRDGITSFTSLALEDFGAPGWPAYKALMDKDGLAISRLSALGYTVAETFVEALKRSGKDLTREKLATSIEALNGWSCGLCNGPLTFSPTSHWGFEKLVLLTSKNGKWVKD